jgi:catechol 2,3-dioxygenase-like lactoylglutathione lyase family enzyme
MVSRVGHVGLRVTDLERSVDFAQRILGMREVDRDMSVSYLTCNDRHHELVLLEGETAGCDHLAFEVYDRTALALLREGLARRGVEVLDEPLECGVEEAVRFVGPGGFVFEVFYGMARDEPTRYETVGVRPRKFEHITLKSAVKEELERFLQEVLGLRISDHAEKQIVWLRASDEHHGVSIIRAEINQLQHYAWQVDWDSIRRVGDRLLAHGRTFLWGPGHHGIGNNYFCYFVDADGAIVEYSADIERIEDELRYTPRVWPDVPLSVNCWGNPPPPMEFIDGGIPLVHPASVAALQ